MKRRQLLVGLVTGSVITGLAGIRSAVAGKMIKPWEWVEKKDEIKNTDGTPLQFMPKNPKDNEPLKNEFQKYPRCPYCGMGRKMWSHTRHLIHYEDDLVDGTCSIHCAAISLSLNLDRVPKSIYVGDAGADGKVKPLIQADKAHYVIDGNKMGTMTKRSKWAYSNRSKAESFGKKVVNFDQALVETYADMAKDTILIRKRREEKRRKAKRG